MGETDATKDKSPASSSTTLTSRSGMTTRMEVDDSNDGPPVGRHLPVLNSRSGADLSPKKNKTSPKDKFQEKKLNNSLDASSSSFHHQQQQQQQQLQVHPRALLP